MTAQTFSDALGEISEKYIMEAIAYEGKPIRRANHPIRYRVVRAAACILLAVLLVGSMILTFSVEARAAFFSWIRTQYENTFVYYFFGPENTELPTYVLGWVPEGYEEVEWKQVGDIVRWVYRRSDGDELLTFHYYPMFDGIAIAITSVGTEPIEPEPVTVNGMEGEFYLSPDGSESSGLVWFDWETNLAFDIVGFFDKGVLLRIAENVRLESS